jgi:hypothetical protein
MPDQARDVAPAGEGEVDIHDAALARRQHGGAVARVERGREGEQPRLSGDVLAGDGDHLVLADDRVVRARVYRLDRLEACSAAGDVGEQQLVGDVNQPVGTLHRDHRLGDHRPHHRQQGRRVLGEIGLARLRRERAPDQRR